MNEFGRAPRVTACAKSVLERIAIFDNPYLRALSGGSMTLDGFRRSQEAFFFAVTFFPRPMAALIGRIPDPRQRLDILHNLVEEHAEIDERHAEEFFAVIEPAWDDEQRRYYVEQGLELGSYVFDRLFRDLDVIAAGDPAPPR